MSNTRLANNRPQRSANWRHPLALKVAGVARRARRLRWLFGMGRVAAVVLAGGVLLALADFQFRYQDPGLRILSTGALGLVVAWGLWRYLSPLVRRGPSRLTVARRIEQRFPQLSDSLSSSIDFLERPENDPTSGSPALQAAVIRDTTERIAEVDLHEVIDPWPTRRAVMMASLTVLVVAMLWTQSPESVQLATARLIKPLEPQPWPKRHALSFEAPPTRLALGRPFDVELTDRNGTLPDEVLFHTRDEDGTIDTEPMQPRG
ncbi:MAG: hypothetical protein WD176_02180, partial [Pirellulales bacterium]